MWYIKHSALGTTWTKGVKYIKKIGDKYIYPAIKAVGSSAKKLASDVSEDIEDTKRAYERNRKIVEENNKRNENRKKRAAFAKLGYSRNDAVVRENEEEAAYTNARRRAQTFKNKGNPDAIRENREETTYTNASRIRKKEAKRNENIEKARKNIRNKADTDIAYMRKYIEKQKKLANELDSEINELRRRNPPVDRSYINSLESKRNAALDEVRLNKKYIKQLMDNPTNLPYNYGQRRASREKMNSTRT